MKTLLHILDWLLPWTMGKVHDVRFGILAAKWGWYAAGSEEDALDDLVKP